jgi:polysaccharide pyruvyl transferase WcaK-like protein
MAAYIMRRASSIIARDRESQKLAKEIVGRSKLVLLSPDVAFSMEFTIPENLNVTPPVEGDFFEKPVIGLNVNGLMYNGGYNRNNMFDLKLDYPSFLSKLIPALLEEQSGDLLLVPHTYAQPGNVESDNEACRLLRESLSEDTKRRVYELRGEYDPHELKGIIGKCKFFIGSRMHSCIAALSQGVPCVGVAYSKKIEGVFDTVGMAEWLVDGRRLSSAEALERVLELFRKRGAVKDDLLRSAEGARKQLLDVFKKLFSSDIF